MKISIITPSFNQAEFIERTILSVISQKGDFEIEYIIMDGGSSDDTVQIFKEYESRIKKIRAEPIIKVKHEKPENTDNKILGGVSQAVSDATGINVEVIRILFLVSFVFLIGIPVYALLSLFIKEN